MSNSPASAIAAAADPFSEVRTADRVMRYRRSGAGSTVLLLSGAANPSPMSAELVAALGARFRIIVPDVPEGATVATWVPEFLEGLGTCQVAVIAADHLCMPAIELACRGVEQVRQLILFPDGEPDDAAPDRSITAAIGAPAIPALIIRPGLPTAEAVALVTTFLAGA